MICDRCFHPLDTGEHGQYKCPYEPRSASTNVISDEIPGGFVQEHFGVQPETFYSKREMARRAKELGLTPFVRHVGEQGSDKSSKTSRWI